MTETEEWRPVVGYEGLYEVSSLGRVRSLDRRVNSRWGQQRTVPGRIMRLSKGNATGHLTATLTAPGGKPRRVLVHRAVALAFIPNPEGHPFVLHWNDDAGDNRVSNLRWGTHSDNMRDMVRNGNHVESRKTHCPKGHPYSEENTYVNSKGFRRCLTCRELRRTSGLPLGDPRHGTYNGYDNYGCRCVQCSAVGGYPGKNRKREEMKSRLQS